MKPSKPYRVVLLTNPWYECLEDTAKLLSLGLGCDLVTCKPESLSLEKTFRPVILGLHASPQARIPGDSVIFNTEHPSTWSPEYRYLLNTHETWTYSDSSRTGLMKHVPLGYHESFPLIPLKEVQDIDVLHFGSLNDRRVKILNEMTVQHDLRVHAAPLGTFGRPLADLISRSKVILNVHYYTEPACFEYARVVPLIHSEVCVLSEISQGREGQGLAAMAPYEQIAKDARFLVDHPEARARISQSCLRTLKSKPMSKILEQVTGEKS